MNHFRKLTASVLVLMLTITLCACGEKKKDDLFSEENYQNRSDQVADDGWTDGIDDQYIFTYEISIEPKSGIEGVMVTGITDTTTTDILILKTRVSRYNDPKVIVGIGPGAFANHTEIEKVTLSDTVAMIGEGAFEDCTNLKTVELTTTVWLLDQNVFSGCTSLETIHYNGTMAQFGAIQCEERWAPVGQTITIICSDGSLIVDRMGNSVPASKESENVRNPDSASVTESLSIQQRPTLEEFSWYEEVSANGFWDDATPVMTTEQMLGGWKGLIVRDPARTRDSYSQELVNVDISIEGSEAVFMVDRFKIYMDGESYDRSSENEMRFTGEYSNQELQVIGQGSISIGLFYEYMGHQYAMGVMMDPDGVIADICLMR